MREGKRLRKDKHKQTCGHKSAIFVVFNKFHPCGESSVGPGEQQRGKCTSCGFKAATRRVFLTQIDRDELRFPLRSPQVLGLSGATRSKASHWI